MTDQTPAAKPARKPRAKPAGGLKQLTQAEAEAAVASYRKANPAITAFASKQFSDRPYLTDSTIVQDDIRRHYDKALAEIDAIDADLLAIATNANRDVESIRNREAVETAARQNRRQDLALIVAMAARAIGVPDTTADQPEHINLERQAPQLTLRSSDDARTPID